MGNGRPELGIANTAIQQTVMSHALWSRLDHLPGSCLLLILRC
jgi:hypothetical protein